MINFFFRLGQGLLGLLFFALFFLNSCMTFRTNDQKLQKYFSENATDVQIHRQKFDGKPIRFVETKAANGNSEKLVLFVHGAPGSLDAFNKYLSDSTLNQNAKLIALDRLGYGFSNFGKSETAIHKQAEQVRYILEQYPSKQVVLVGHSYGGPIVARCAIDYPDLVDAIVMLAPVNDPASEPVFWFAHFAKWKWSRWMLPKTFKVSGDEKFSHVAELVQMQESWQYLNVPVVHIHGHKDQLAPPANIQFSENNIPADHLKSITLPESGHFIPWKNYTLVKAELLALLDSE